jgi:hypothetical protein
MRKVFPAAASALLLLFAAGCGLVYQAGSGYRAHKMSKELKLGATMPEVHNRWGEPDIRTYPDPHTEIWSYAVHANSNDLAAKLLYTSAKEGDSGTFMDLKFVDGRLVSWRQTTHTMPPKEGPGFTASFANPGVGGGNATGAYPNMSHY